MYNNKNKVLFETLSYKELCIRSESLEEEARIFEAKLESIQRYYIDETKKEDRQRLARLHRTGNKIWRKLRALERCKRKLELREKE